MGDAKSNLDVAPGSGDALAPLRLIALVLVQEGHVALSLGRGEHWRVDAGYTFIPLALPGGAMDDSARSALAVDADATLDARIERIGRAHLGQPARVRRGRWCYGASDAHAVDRRAVSAEDAPGPLLEVRRALPLDDDHAPGIADVARPPLRSVVVRAYRVALAGPAMPGPETAGLVWLTLDALRRTIGGLPLADWRKLRGARCDIAKDATLPDDAFVYVPGDYGERYLLRAASKYGVEAVLPPDDAG
ncbi:MAG TPA: hypothetical protein VIC85_17730 [Ktedonobacterales bacterium]|jgi:hypothetical protein